MILPIDFKVWLHSKPIDMRKGVNGLSILVIEELQVDLQSGNLFIFYNKDLNRLKILYYHYNGFCLLQKRLEKDRFKIPKILPHKIEVSNQQLSRLLEGLYFTKSPDTTYDIFY